MLPTESEAYVPEVHQFKHLGDRKRLLLEKSQRRQDLCPPCPEALSLFLTPLGQLSEIQWGFVYWTTTSLGGRSWLGSLQRHLANITETKMTSPLGISKMFATRLQSKVPFGKDPSDNRHTYTHTHTDRLLCIGILISCWYPFLRAKQAVIQRQNKLKFGSIAKSNTALLEGNSVPKLLSNHTAY